MCAVVSDSENGVGRLMKTESYRDRTFAGRVMEAVGKSQTYASQQMSVPCCIDSIAFHNSWSQTALNVIVVCTVKLYCSCEARWLQLFWKAPINMSDLLAFMMKKFTFLTIPCIHIILACCSLAFLISVTKYTPLLNAQTVSTNGLDNYPRGMVCCYHPAKLICPSVVRVHHCSTSSS